MSKSIRRKISNPYVGLEGYHCFGCSPDNEQGLKMEFYEEGESVLCDWIPVHHFGGYKNVLHGGIQATLLDEIAAWTVQVKLKTAGVTANIDLKFKKPVFTNKGNLLLKAHIEKVVKRIAYVRTELYDHENEFAAKASLNTFYIPKRLREKNFIFRSLRSFSGRSD